MPEAFAKYTRANVAWRAVEDRMNFEEGFHISEAEVDAVFRFLAIIQEDREAAAGQLGLIRGALSLPLDPSPSDLETIAEELGPAGAKLLKEILEEDAADAAPPTDGLAARAFKWASSFFAGDSDGEADL